MNKRLPKTKLLVVPVILFVLLSHHMYAENSLTNLMLGLVGYLLLIMSAMGRIWASAYISGKKNKELVTDGPYSIVRNPLYFFSFLGFVGAGLVFESILIATALTIIFFVTHWSTILKEEDKLRTIFGQTFENYAHNVPRFIPDPRKLNNPEVANFDPALFSKTVIESSLILLVFAVAYIDEWAYLNSVIPTLLYIP